MSFFSQLSKEKYDFLRLYYLKEKNLTKCETEVLVLVLQGYINKEVAKKRGVKEKNIKFHLMNIYKKLHISRRTQIFWTLPLTNFVKVDDARLAPQQNEQAENPVANDENSESLEEGAIPKGISIVTDSID